MPDALLAPAPDPLRRLRIRTRLRHGRARRLTAHRPRSAASRARALTRPAPPACTKMQKEMKETGKDVAAVHVSEDERDGDEAAAQQRAAAHARLLMQNQVQQQPEQQQFQPQMHMQLAGSGAMAASGEKRERGERGERGGVERAAGADGGCVERVSHCVASVHDVHDVSAGAVHAECAAASSVEGVRSVPVQHDKGRPRDEGEATAWSMGRESRAETRERAERELRKREERAATRERQWREAREREAVSPAASRRRGHQGRGRRARSLKNSGKLQHEHRAWPAKHDGPALPFGERESELDCARAS